jgi:hypothetical protein
MKHLFLFSFLAILLFSACNSTPNVEEYQQKPEDVAKAFFEALSEQEFQKAIALGTAHTQEQVKLYATELGMAKEDEREAMIASRKLNFKSVSCTEQEGSMICKVCCNTEGAEAEAEVVQLENKWFVQITLDDNY